MFNNLPSPQQDKYYNKTKIEGCKWRKKEMKMTESTQRLRKNLERIRKLSSLPKKFSSNFFRQKVTKMSRATVGLQEIEEENRKVSLLLHNLRPLQGLFFSALYTWDKSSNDISVPFRAKLCNSEQKISVRKLEKSPAIQDNKHRKGYWKDLCWNHCQYFILSTNDIAISFCLCVNGPFCPLSSMLFCRGLTLDFLVPTCPPPSSKQRRRLYRSIFFISQNKPGIIWRSNLGRACPPFLSIEVHFGLKSHFRGTKNKEVIMLWLFNIGGNMIYIDKLINHLSTSVPCVSLPNLLLNPWKATSLDNWSPTLSWSISLHPWHQCQFGPSSPPWFLHLCHDVLSLDRGVLGCWKFLVERSGIVSHFLAFGFDFLWGLMTLRALATNMRVWILKREK